MEQAALGKLAEQAAELAERGDVPAITQLVQVAASVHGYAPWAMTSLIAAEWDRLGIRRVPRGTILGRPV